MLTIEQMAKLATKYHWKTKTYDEYLVLISARPGAWIDVCNDFLAREKAEIKANRKLSFTKAQKNLIEKLQKQPVWRTFCDIDQSKTLSSLIKRGVVSRIEYGAIVEYRVHEYAIQA